MTSEATAQTVTADSDREETRAALDALNLAHEIARGQLPRVAPFGRLPPGESCHFVTPVRFGRRRDDQFGHLELTSGWLRFHGALDLSVVWTEVASVERTGQDIVVSLTDSTRSFCFSCHWLGEAARGTMVAAYLANVAHEVRL